MSIRYKFFGNSINRCDVRHLLLVLTPNFSSDWIERKNRNLFVFYVTLEEKKRGNSRGFALKIWSFFFRFSNMFTLLDLRAISIVTGCCIVSFAFKLKQSDEYNDWNRNQINGERNTFEIGQWSHQSSKCRHLPWNIFAIENKKKKKKNEKFEFDI